MHTIYQTTDEFGHVLRTVKVPRRGDRVGHAYQGLVIMGREVLFKTRETASKEAVMRKLQAYVANKNTDLSAAALA